MCGRPGAGIDLTLPCITLSKQVPSLRRKALIRENWDADPPDPAVSAALAAKAIAEGLCCVTEEPVRAGKDLAFTCDGGHVNMPLISW